MSHDIRTPLNAITGFIAIAEKNKKQAYSLWIFSITCWKWQGLKTEKIVIEEELVDMSTFDDTFASIFESDIKKRI